MGDITFSATSTQKVHCVSVHGMRRHALTAVDRQRYLEDPALAATEDPGVFPSSEGARIWSDFQVAHWSNSTTPRYLSSVCRTSSRRLRQCCFSCSILSFDGEITALSGCTRLLEGISQQGLG